MSRRRRRTPALDQLAAEERGRLLDELLAAHPDWVEETERAARALLSIADPEVVADEVEHNLRHADADQLAVRAGRVYGRGYVHEAEAAAEMLEEQLEPYLADLRRRAALGLSAAASMVGVGVLRGLDACRTRVADGTVLAYAGEDAPGELTYSVFAALADAGISLSADQLAQLPADWHDVAG